MTTSIPPDAVAQAYTASSLQQSWQHLEALKIYDQLIRRAAATPAIWRAAGSSLLVLGEFAQAKLTFEQSLLGEPAHDETEHGLSQALFSLGDVDAACARIEAVARRTNALASWLGLATMIPGAPSASGAVIREMRSRFATELTKATPPSAIAPRVQSRPPASAPLKIGYISAFFDQPNYMRPVWGLINHHDRARFAPHLFSDKPPPWPGYQPHPADVVHAIGALDNVEVAALVRQCEIDVLVDLNGYSAAQRLPLFLGHPAPVNLAWFNMYATSGLPGLDWIIGDAQVALPAEDEHYTERVHRLPLSYVTFEAQYDTESAPPVAQPPCVAHGVFTFGSLVSQYKITPVTLDTWAAILRGAPQSRLLLANRAMRSEENRKYVQEQFASRGVAAHRLDLRKPARHGVFLRYYDEIDLALDAFPYNGGTTTTEALWQGVPVLTTAGDRWAARTSRTLLHHAGLGAFVAANAQEMAARAVALARDRATPARLDDLRQSMRARLAASPLCNTAALARALEQFFIAAARR
jgi:protein O-GlcNAc transferase